MSFPWIEETVNDDSHGAFNLVAISAALPVTACPGRIRFRFSPRWQVSDRAAGATTPRP